MGPYFFLFMCVWIYMRHYLNLRIIYSLFTEYKTVGPYELDWAGGQYKCELGFWITLSLLASLQSLNLFWLFFIVRIAYRLVVHNVAEDDRSDAEDTEVDDKAVSHPSPLVNTTQKVAATAESNGTAALRSSSS
jgi:very-long-chain ceramide synthase